MQQIEKQKRIWVDLSRIDERPGPCCMSFGYDLKPLVKSIETVGLVNPPFVAREGKAGLGIVAGYRRLMALKTLHWDRVPCWDLSGLSLRERVLFNFYDNYATRGFNEVEISMVLRRMVSHLSKEQTLREYMPLLGLPSHEQTLDLYLALETLESPIKMALVKKTLSLRALKPLLDTDADTRQAVFDWMSQFKFNLNQQIQVIDYLLDLCENEHKRVPALLEEEGLTSLGQDRGINTPQKAKQVLDRLRARCHPSLTRAEQVFRTRVARLRLPDGAAIKHPPFFEDPHYRLEIAFRNGKALTEKLKALFGLEGLQKIGDPWSED